MSNGAKIVLVLGCLLGLSVNHGSGQLPIVTPGGLSVTVDGKLIGTFTSLIFTSGSGVLWTYIPNGSTLTLAAGQNSATVLTRGILQSGACDFLNSTNGTAAYTYNFGPVCTAVTAYTRGMHFKLVADVTNASGSCSLNIDNVGLRNIKDKTGQADPPKGFIVPGQEYSIWFDASVFRLE